MRFLFSKNKPAVKKKPQKARKTNKEQEIKDEEQPEVSGSGQIIQKKSASAGKIAAFAFIIFVGIGAVISFGNLFSPKSVAEPVLETGISKDEQQAAEYARGYVGAWLRATRKDDAELSRYIQLDQADITAEEPTEYRELAVASSETDDNGVSTVIVSAEIETPKDSEEDDTEDSDDASSGWEPTWYQVNIYNEQGTFVPLGWPAPVAAPETGSAPRMAYAYEGSDEIKETVNDFFEAYILGNGEVARLTHPESTIRPLDNPSYAEIDVQDVTTDEDYRNNVPEDGTTVKTYVYLHLGTSQDEGRVATYALTLETRGGRWEVRTLEPAPVVKPGEITIEEQPADSDSASEEALDK